MEWNRYKKKMNYGEFYASAASVALSLFSIPKLMDGNLILNQFFIRLLVYFSSGPGEIFFFFDLTTPVDICT